MIIKKEQFCEWIEQNKRKTAGSYIDAVLNACETFNISETLCKDLLNVQIISQLEAEAKSLNFIKRTSFTISEFI